MELHVSEGEVVKVYHLNAGDGGNLSGYFQNSYNNSLATSEPRNTMLYEITKLGFRALSLDHLSTNPQSALVGASQIDLTNLMLNSVNLSGNAKVSAVKSLPDVSKTGTSTGVVTVKEALSNGTEAKWDYTVNFNVEKQIDVVAKNQKIPYGDTEDNYDPKTFVEVRDAKGDLTNDFDATFTSFPVGPFDDTQSYIATVKVTPLNSTTSESYNIQVPIKYVFDDALNLLGENNRRIATFSLVKSASGPNVHLLKATYDGANNALINASFGSNIYYKLGYATGLDSSMSTSLKTGLLSNNIEFKGEQAISDLGAAKLSSLRNGDYIHVYHAEADSKLEFYKDGNKEISVVTGVNDRYYEVTTDGFCPLMVNTLKTPSTIKIKQFSDQKTVLEAVAKAMNISQYSGLSISAFATSQTIDSSKVGSQTVSVRVDEQKNSGTGKFTWDYPINFEIEKFDNTDASSPEPPKSDMWINVTVPTSMEFHSTDGSGHTEIDGSGTITNNSGRPLKVEVSQFSSNSLAGVKTLELNGKSLFNLSTPALIGTIDSTPNFDILPLNITGTVDSSLQKQEKSSNTLELKFTALKADESPY